MRSRRYHLASTSAMNFSLNSTVFTENLLKLIQMSLSVSGELPPGQYFVTVEYRNFVGPSQIPPYWQDKSASPPSIPPTSSKEATKPATSRSSTSKKPSENPSTPTSDGPSEPSTPNPSSVTSTGSTITTSPTPAVSQLISRLGRIE